MWLPLAKPKVIFFDAGGTLFRPYPSVGEVYARAARRHGVHAEPERLEKLFRQSWHARSGLASLVGATSDKIERDWWYGLVKDVFAQGASFADFEAFFAELYDEFAQAHCWRLFEDALPILRRLRKEGYRLGMISNWDQRLFSIVRGLELEIYFEQVLASSSVGVAKPGIGIFHQALQAMRVESFDALHVGDSVQDDYYGARNAGMQAVLLNRDGKAYNDVIHIPTLDSLPTLWQ